MTRTDRTFYVAGAGIAGLSLALALAKFGATVVVLEHRKALQTVGAGVQISPNARKALNRLGLDAVLARDSFEPGGIDVYSHWSTRPFVSLELGGTMRSHFGAPYSVMHRADLAGALHTACRRFANIDIRFGTEGFDAESHQRGAAIIVDRGNGGGYNARAFAFIGADGVHSATRSRVLGGPQARHSGHVAWRATLPAAALASALPSDRVSLLLDSGYHAVCYPLVRREQVNVVLTLRHRARGGADVSPGAPALPWGAFPSRPMRAILESAEGRWSGWPIYAVDATTWSRGAVGLIGDAIHATPPYHAQGAALAIEDALVLAPLLVTEPDAETAFARFKALRQPRLVRARQLARANQFAFHLEWPFSIARDAVLRFQGPRGHIRRLAWLYGFELTGDPEI